MASYAILTIVTGIALFIMFLVISRTLNTILNLLIKLEYIVQREHDLKKEALELRIVREREHAEAKREKESRRVSSSDTIAAPKTTPETPT